TTRDIRRALDEDATRRADVHGVEVKPILDLRCVGETQFLVDGLLLHQGVVCFDIERDVMRRAGAKAPAPGRTFRLDVQVDDPSGTGSRHFESMVGTIEDRKSTRLNSSHVAISYAVF